MPQIKIKNTEKQAVKVADRTLLAEQKAKKAYVTLREKAEHSQLAKEDSATEYAAERVNDAVSHAAQSSVRQAAKLGEKGIGKSGDVMRYTAAKIGAYRRNHAEHAANQRFSQDNTPHPAEQRTAPTSPIHSPASVSENRPQTQKPHIANPSGNGTEKTADTAVPKIRQAVRTKRTKIETVRNTGRKTVRTGRTGVRDGQSAVRTISHTEKIREYARRLTARTAQKAIHTAQQTAYVTEKAVTAAVHAAVTTAKVIAVSTKALLTAIVSGGSIAVLTVLVVVLFGCSLSMLGGEESGTTLPVSEAVQAYEPLIRQYAAQYEISEYVNLIMAVMMQESGGQGLDPMQSAEGAFNTRYPHTPNGITDPAYSIECGVQELKNCLLMAHVDSPIDIEHIRLALQGYNFGDGYIRWALSHYNGYSLQNAAEFSALQA